MVRKLLSFEGTARQDLKAFPEIARSVAGQELYFVQIGERPADWKPMPTIGQGVAEIRIHRGGAFRVIYIARFEEAVYVLHCFQKKSQRTSRTDLELATTRYKALITRRGAR